MKMNFKIMELLTALPLLLLTGCLAISSLLVSLLSILQEGILIIGAAKVLGLPVLVTLTFPLTWVSVFAYLGSAYIVGCAFGCISSPFRKPITV
jgi:hypothetical protein